MPDRAPIGMAIGKLLIYAEQLDPRLMEIDRPAIVAGKRRRVGRPGPIVLEWGTPARMALDRGQELRILYVPGRLGHLGRIPRLPGLLDEVGDHLSESHPGVTCAEFFEGPEEGRPRRVGH